MPNAHVHLRDSDNTAFEAAWPPNGRRGTLGRRLALARWGDDWYIVDLDEPVLYQGASHDRVLIRARWAGHPIGGPGLTSVFVLLTRDEASLAKPLPEPAEFGFVAWALVEPSQPPNHCMQRRGH